MAASVKSGVQLEVYSDVICPWCYVGKARLDKALGLVSYDVPVAVCWKPFELNPTMPPDGMNRQDYLIRKFGSSDISGMQQKLSAAGDPDGLQFNFVDIKTVPNTFKAHRLLWFAHAEGKQDALAEILFRRYFTDGLDVGDIENLVAAAFEAGISADAARTFLTSDAGAAEVRAEEEAGLSLGIKAVPTFVINGRVVASGALAVDELSKLLEKAAQEILAKL